MAQITFGAGFLNPEKMELGIEMIKVLEKYNIRSIDTSRVYVCLYLALSIVSSKVTCCGIDRRMEGVKSSSA